MEFIKYINKKKALYRTIDGYKIRKIINYPVVLNTWENQLYKRYSNSAKLRGYDFELSTDTFKRLINCKCYYCGTIPSQKQGNILYNGIDRLDNKKGYNIDNCLASCGTCNKMKGTMSRGEFDNHLKNIFNNMKEEILAFENIDSAHFNIETTMNIVNKRLEQSGAAVLSFIEKQERT